MKIKKLQASLPLAAILIALAFAAQTVAAQDIMPGDSVALSYGVPQVLQLSQANVGDDVIVRYIQNSGTIYALNAPEIIYLKQEGVSDVVLSAMLDQRKRLTGSTEPATTTAATQIAAAPNPVFVQPINYNNYYVARPSSTVYVMPDTQSRRYEQWSYDHPYACYGNGYYEWPYSCSSVVVIGTGYRHSDYPVHEHIVLRH
jgi:hypothetical protein